MNETDSRPARVRLPRAAALAARTGAAAWLTPEGEVLRLTPGAAAARARALPVMMVHAPATARRLGGDHFPALDLLELFAFVRPARFCLPTARGLAEALDLDRPADFDGEAAVLREAARALLIELAENAARPDRRRDAIARAMARGGWPWGPAVLSALGIDDDKEPAGAFEVWLDLAEWSEHAPPPAPGHQPVDPADARRRLAQLVGAAAEDRPQQGDYASAVSAAFAPRERSDEPTLVLAEAGTGVGKTLGYIAPASLWAQANGGTVWISTYTRNLQHQIDTELDKLYPDPVLKAAKVVVRKGRENYLCLLNFEDAARALAGRAAEATALGLMARWIAASRDGDMIGGDFPGWLADLIGRRLSLRLADRRGECVYSACPHYHKCFIERSVRRARRAEIVVANHALVMIQAALGGGDAGGEAPGTGARLPTRYVFDEGHHVFDAADGAFSALLSAQEGTELRRWLLGAEDNRRRNRARGLKRRVEDLTAGDEAAAAALVQALNAARALPSEGWTTRLSEGAPRGEAERFLMLVRQQVYARSADVEAGYGIETEVRPPVPGLAEAAHELERALGRLRKSLGELAARLGARLDTEADTLDSATRLRIEATQRSLKRRGENDLGAWQAMLAGIEHEPPPAFVDWLAVERMEGRDLDVGLCRHWRDPTQPFAETVLKPAHGVVVTSATLKDASGDMERDWAAAGARTGACHLARPALRAEVSSPFDYPAQTRVFIVTDVAKGDMDQVAAAYRDLFLAAGGGALGLFTAIARLRAVHRRIAPAIEQAGLDLLAQHVDAMDTATLVDIFRAEEDACLLGTDAVRDGVDVPGRSLRLIVFDRVPWPRPGILHRARASHFGAGYNDMLTRLRLKQAFGRLIRRADDHGVFVLLDRALPSRLLGAFPAGVEIGRAGLAETIAAARAFLHEKKG